VSDSAHAEPDAAEGEVGTVKRVGQHRAKTGVVLLACAIVSAVGSTGCGGTLYAIHAGAASSKVEEAKAVGAEQLAPYEYYLAVEHMKKASEEASQADYGDAVDLAEMAEEFATKAIKLSRDAHKGAGR
jgi:hypothetical protein